MTETELKQEIKNNPRPLYVLYGAETYPVEQYARLIAKQTVEEDMSAFNLQKFDGQAVTVPQLQEAVEALPMMADKKCVLVRDMDAGAADNADLVKLIDDLPDSCVLVFWQMTVQPDTRKGWKAFLDRAKEVGTVMEFKVKTADEAAKMLVSGAKRRGCELDMRDARYLVEQAGNDLNLLLRELDKLCAVVGDGGVITRGVIDSAATKNLEAKVFDLSKAILRRDTAGAFQLVPQLEVQREDPVPILAVMSGAYADLYRAKVAATAGVPAGSLAADFKGYKGKEWKLNNAERDSRRLSVACLRQSLEVLAEADIALKLNHSGDRLVLEQTVIRLIQLAQEG